MTFQKERREKSEETTSHTIIKQNLRSCQGKSERPANGQEQTHSKTRPHGISEYLGQKESASNIQRQGQVILKDQRTTRGCATPQGESKTRRRETWDLEA